MHFFLASAAAAVVGLSLLSGCSDKEPTADETLSPEQQQIKAAQGALDSLPEWITSPTVENGISAVGAARWSKGGMTFMLPQAEMDGKAKLAGRIQEEVSRLQDSNRRLVQTQALDVYDSNFKQVTEILVKRMPLSGAKRLKTHMADDGTLYVLMAIQKRDVADYLDNTKQQLKADMEEARMTREAIEEGMEVLDSSITEMRAQMD